METMTLGRTGITVNRNGFGALPVQRVEKQEAARLLRRAYEGGIRWFDTARAYSDSEEKLGLAFTGLPRESYYLSTKTAAVDELVDKMDRQVVRHKDRLQNHHHEAAKRELHA